MIDNAILERIKKLLSLGGNNPNENEARAALAKAAKLAEEHNLAISDIDLTTKEIKVIQDKIIIRDSNKTWLAVLTHIVGKCFDSKPIYIKAWITDDDGFGQEVYHCVFVGMKMDVELSVWYVKNIQLRISKTSESKFKNQKGKIAFAYGATLEVENRLKSMFIEPRERERSQATKDLIVVKHHEVQKAFQELFPHTRKMNTRNVSLGDGSAFHSGREYGKIMPITRQVS